MNLLYNTPTMETQKKSRFLKVAVIIGIVVVLNLFFNYALSLIYKSPDYLTFCPNSQVVKQVATQEECVSIGGQWDANSTVVSVEKGNLATPAQPAGYCNQNYTCQKKFDEASRIYNRNVFIALVILGAVSLIVGVLLSANVVVSSGLAYGGVLSFIIASIGYWSSADDLIKVVILAIALALLIYIAIKKFKD